MSWGTGLGVGENSLEEGKRGPPLGRSLASVLPPQALRASLICATLDLPLW